MITLSLSPTVNVTTMATIATATNTTTRKENHDALLPLIFHGDFIFLCKDNSVGLNFHLSLWDVMCGEMISPFIFCCSSLVGGGLVISCLISVVRLKLRLAAEVE